MADGTGDVAQLLAIMARLRDPETGCQWDRQQTFASIAPYTIEEAYEVADAIDRDDMADLRGELGDLLLQVVFHAQMASERGAFVFADVVAAINAKLIRRHPHVFAGSGSAEAPGTVPDWEAIKRTERDGAGETDPSALAGIARGLPEWQRAVKLQQRAARVGFDWPGPGPVLDKLAEEVDEARAEFAALAAQPDDALARRRLEEEIGDVLFVCANLARHANVDVGSALRHANRKFERRFRAMEELSAVHGGLAGLTLQDKDAYWERVKRDEAVGSGHAAAAPSPGK